MKFFKKHKTTVFIIVIFVVAVLILFWAWTSFFSNSGKPEYGDRLDNIENFEITKSDLSNIQSNLEKNEKVKKVSTNISGRTLDIVITVEGSTSLKDAKEIGKSSYSNLTEKQIDYFSVQVFMTKEEAEENNFPIIGYKQRGTTSLIWTKDREVTKTNETE